MGLDLPPQGSSYFILALLVRSAAEGDLEIVRAAQLALALTGVLLFARSRHRNWPNSPFQIQGGFGPHPNTCFSTTITDHYGLRTSTQCSVLRRSFSEITFALDSIRLVLRVVRSLAHSGKLSKEAGFWARACATRDSQRGLAHRLVIVIVMDQ